MLGDLPEGRLSLDESQLVHAAELLRALSSPHRLAIVLTLADRPSCVHELVDALGISQSLASQHLRVLRTTRLVTGVRRGKETEYAIADEHVVHIARDALIHGSEAGHRTAPHAPTHTPTHTDSILEEHSP